jgi:Tol biopolymer transport system component
MPAQIGAYPVDREIGRGGMGVVYLARDTQLDRDVAIKALPEELASDPARLVRFEREGKALAQLNHPNVAGIYGVEEQDGRKYLILEYVDGDTLGDRLDAGPIPLEETLELAAAIAAGLEAAHEVGVIHRDLKPDNVKITPDGVVKVLDFGLAKATESGSTSGLTDSPTVTTPRSPTIPGAILGTAPYMSPEQARGRAVDTRTDIWSFGVMLYEMLTGSGPFVGETATDSIGAILHKAPDFDRLPATTPPTVRRALRRCLERDKARRYRHIGDVALDLADSTADASGSTPPPVRRPLLPWLVATVVITIAASSAAWMVGAQGGARQPDEEVWFELPADVSSILITRRFALSPDGRALAYVDDRGRVLVQNFQKPGVQVLVDTFDARTVFFSPDGRWVGFWSEGALRKVLVSGGSPIAIARMGPTRSADWGANGEIAYCNIVGGLRVVAADGGVPRDLIAQDRSRPAEWHTGLSYLPSGDGILFASPRGVELADARTGVTRTIVANAANPRYLGSGELLYRRDGGTLWAVPFDAATGEMRGTPRLVQDEPVDAFDVAENGTLVFLEPKLEFRRRLVLVSSTGVVEDVGLEARAYLHPRISPDGRRVAASIAAMTRDAGSIWILDLHRGVPRRLVTGASWPVWIDGGRRVAHATFERGMAGELLARQADGSDEPTIVVPSDRLPIPMSWSQERETLAYYDYGEQADVWTQAEGEQSREFVVTEADERAPVFSPDGNWIAFVSDETGRDEIHVRSFPDAAKRVIVSTAGGTEPRWAPDGSAIHYRHGAAMMRVEFDPAALEDIPAPETLFVDPRLAVSPVGRGNPNYDIMPDGRFLMVQNPEGRSRTRLQIVLHWGQRLRTPG